MRNMTEEEKKAMVDFLLGDDDDEDEIFEHMYKDFIHSEK